MEIQSIIMIVTPGGGPLAKASSQIAWIVCLEAVERGALRAKVTRPP